MGKFGGTENGYGVFPFNNTSNTSSGKGTNDNLDYGFGIRLDIDFRVPKNGLLADDKPATFNFSGDDDLWVYIGEDSTGANGRLLAETTRMFNMFLDMIFTCCTKNCNRIIGVDRNVHFRM